MKPSFLVLSVLPGLLTLAACGGNVSTESPSESSEQGLIFRASTTAKQGPVLAVSRLTPRVSDSIGVQKPVYRLSPTVIDDFTVGQEPVNLIDSDTFAFQRGTTANIVGGVRRSSLNVRSSENATVLDIPSGGPMFIDSETLSYWSVDLRYGFGEEGPEPLNLGAASYDRFRLNFDALDAGVDYSLSVADGNGNVAYSDGVQSTSSFDSPFFTDFLFSRLHGPAEFNWNDVDAIYLSFYTVSTDGGNDVKLRSIIAQ